MKHDFASFWPLDGIARENVVCPLIALGNFALGDSRFVDEIAEMLGRRVTPGKVSRPRKNHVVHK